MSAFLFHSRRVTPCRLAAVVALLGSQLLHALPAQVLAAKPTRPPTAAKTGNGQLTIVSMTRGAEVFVNDAPRGEIPLPGPLELAAGQTHTIRVQKRGFAPFVETVILAAGDSKELEADLVPTGGVLKVTSNILRSQVILSGKPLGRTPFDGDVSPGDHQLQVTAAGYLTAEQTVTIKAGESTEIAVELKPVPKPVVKDDTRLIGRWWFWTAIGTAVVGGVAAAVVLSQDEVSRPPQPNGILKL